MESQAVQFNSTLHIQVLMCYAVMSRKREIKIVVAAEIPLLQLQEFSMKCWKEPNVRYYMKYLLDAYAYYGKI